MPLDKQGNKRGPYGRESDDLGGNVNKKVKAAQVKAALRKRISFPFEASSSIPGCSGDDVMVDFVNIDKEKTSDLESGKLDVDDLAVTFEGGQDMESEEAERQLDHDGVHMHVYEEEEVKTYEEMEDDIYFDALEDNEDPSAESEMLTDNLDSKPLFHGSNVTVGAFMLLLAIFFQTHNLVGDAIEQLLSILGYILPQDNRVCSSLYGFNKYFNILKNPLIYHYYCQYCAVSLKDNLLDKCTNPSCLKPLKGTEIPYFLQIPIIHQIKIFFSNVGFFDSLQGRFEKSCPGVLKDIYDGELYNNLFKSNGPLSKPENISFVLNTDGAPVFKSSSYSIWPLFLTINELDFKRRMMPQNLLLAGLWFGPKKPLMETFLKPFLEEFKNLRDGIECFSPERGHFMCKGFLLGATADLPARALLCNSVQYNGSFGCWKCLQKGSTAARGKGHTHIFPFQENDPKGPKRTVQQTLKDADTVMASSRKNFTINGIKGMSWLSLFPSFDFINGMAIDYMHGVLLGTQKLLLRLWFSKEFSTKTYSISSDLEKVDKRLLQICPTLDVSRLPRSISNDLKYWKASEFQNFLLFYGLPVLKGILDQDHWLHYSLFVYAIFILLQNRITDIDLRNAEQMITTFCKTFDDLYESCFMTLNMHQLLHLVDNVRSLGPLYTHSCFPFEDKNGMLMKMIRGTQNIDQQIVKGVSFLQKLPELRYTSVPAGSYISDLCDKIEYPHVLKRRKEVVPGIFILGGIVNRKLTESELTAYQQYTASIYLDTLPTFSRIDMAGMVIYGTEYSRMKKRDNSTIIMNNTLHRFGKVKFFHWNAISKDVLAFVTIVKPIFSDFKVNHIIPVQVTEDIQVVPISAVDQLCLNVSYDDQIFLCKVPNTLLKV